MLTLVSDHAISLEQGIACLTQNPAKILGLDKGMLTPGYAADICIFDATLSWEVNQKNWHSAGKNTPFWGQVLVGRVTHTLQAGSIIFSLR
jgi:dihydroorotase